MRPSEERGNFLHCAFGTKCRDTRILRRFCLKKTSCLMFTPMLTQAEYAVIAVLSAVADLEVPVVLAMKELD